MLDVSRFRPGPWIASSGVLASLLIISWTIFIVTCVVAACVRKRSKKESDHPIQPKGIKYNIMCLSYKSYNQVLLQVTELKGSK